MLKRKMMDELRRWKTESAGTTALMIDGARRVGKSYLAEAFAKEAYRSYLLIDFARIGQDVKKLFQDGLMDLDSFFLYLSGLYGVTLYPGESVLIFDEVQRFPRAREAIKYLIADGRFHYIETGSLVSIRKNVKDIVIPSEERHLKLYPMDFEEFLWALGNETLMPVIEDCYQNRKPMGEALHRSAMMLFRQYMIVGGMPQVVQRYADTRDFAVVDRQKRDILQLYRDDIVKHAGAGASKIEGVFDEIPSALSRHERKFKLSSLQKGARYRDYDDAFFWLSDAMIVNICYNAKEPTRGLKMNRDRVTLKCYMGDTGLLISHTFDENGLVEEEIYRKLLFDKLEVNVGMIVENMVAQMLTASGHALYFYSHQGRDAAARMEIDFLLAKSKVTSRHNISPIEVKSGTRYTLNSIRKFVNRYGEQTHTPYVIHMKDMKEQDGFLYLPIYMVPFL